MVASKHNVAWKRKHDRADRSLTAATVFYPTGLRDLIEICSNPPGKLKAAGSHFALSGAAISDQFFIETNDPAEDTMARTLHDVLPGCMSTSLRQVLRSADPVQQYPIHVEAGKRLYQLYSELDWAVGWDLLGGPRRNSAIYAARADRAQQLEAGQGANQRAKRPVVAEAPVSRED